jgi:dienelactone hydrolase|tara:strand:- start:51 stop:242 length:192 start_codon:yes stop_codon:yes gene_type:complete
MIKKYMTGFTADPPKDPGDQAPIIYYDGMPGGNERTRDYAKNLIKEGYTVKVTSTGKTEQVPG